MSAQDPSWLDLTARHRRQLPIALGYSFGLFLLVAAVFAGLVAARVRFADAEALNVVLAVSGIFVLATLAVAVTVVVGLPRFLSPQGIRVDGSGVEIVSAAKWWFGGRHIHLPWSQVVSVGPGAGRRRWRHGWVVLHLHAIAATAKAPHWAFISHPGDEPPRGEPRSETPRLFLQLHEDDEVELRRRVRAVRPEALSSTPTPPAADPRSPAVAGARPVEDWLSLRLGRVVRWGVWAIVGVMMPLVMLGGWGAANGLADLASDPVALVLLVVAAGGLVTVVGMVPHYWADQGVGVTGRGFSLARRGLWWRRGSSAFVPWEQVLGIAAVWVPGHGFEAEEPTGVEVLLDRAEADPPLPDWAELVAADAARWGRTAAVPRLLISVADPALTRRVVDLLNRHRPEPARQPPPAPPTERAAAEASPAGAAAAAAPVRPAARAPTPATEVRHWISMRRRIFSYVLFQVLSVGFAVAMGATLGPELGTLAGQGLWIALLPTAVAGLVALWLAAIAPRLLVRQGVAVDSAGIDLTQTGALWFRERGVHIPWTDIAGLRYGRALRPSRITDGDLPVGRTIDLVLREPLPRTALPTWTRQRTTGDADGPARLRIHVEKEDALRRAIGAFRPELLS